MPVKPVIEFLYTNIGRGHPFYLDGIVDALIHRGDIGLVRHQQDVFELSRGLSRVGWQTARWLYERGSSGGLVGWVYNRVRGGDYNRPGPALWLMGRHIRRTFEKTDSPLLVAHPTLVGILRNRPNLLYQHGEVVAPQESLVRGAATVLVPTSEVAERFLAAGYSHDAVVTTGLCIEPALARQAADAFKLRHERLSGVKPLTGAFFSSGAEPDGHVEQLVQAAVSCMKAGHSAILFVGQRGSFERRAIEHFQREGIPLQALGGSNPMSNGQSVATLIPTASRRELSAVTARLFPGFDFLVAPSHERVNWALGLGLPLFVVEPCIGPFAGLNRDLVLTRGVGRLLNDDLPAPALGSRISALQREGALSAMAEAGWKVHPIDGFDRIASFLIDRYGR